MRNLRIPVRAVSYKEDGQWIAHCLDFDLLGDGATAQEAVAHLAEAILLQVRASLEENNLANLFSPAEPKYFAMFAAGKDLARGALDLTFEVDGVSIEEPEIREYSDESNPDLVCV